MRRWGTTGDGSGAIALTGTSRPGGSVRSVPNIAGEAATAPNAAITPGDADLVRAAQWDAAAFAALYERYFDAVYRYCARRLTPASTAEDAAATIFGRAFGAIGTCRNPERFRAWLFTIAHNEVTDRYRRTEPTEPLDDRVHLLRDPAASPEEAVIAADAHRDLHAVLAQLPRDQRTVIELKLAGLDGPEIAEVMGRRHGAVRALQHRAFDRLRALLADPDPPNESPGRRPDPYPTDQRTSPTPISHPDKERPR